MIQISERDYNASEGYFIIRLVDDFIMGSGISLGSNDSIDNYYEREYTEEEYNNLLEQTMRAEVINIHRDIIYEPAGLKYKGNVKTIQELNNISSPSPGDLYKVIYDSNDDGTLVLDDNNKPVVLNALYIYEKQDIEELENYTSGWVNVSNSNRIIFNKEL